MKITTKITGAPLPQLSDLVSSLFGSSRVASETSVPWCGAGQTPYWLSRSAHSLAAIARWKAEELGKDHAVIWVPDYFCNGSLGALRDLGAEIVFYPVGPDLDPDWAVCRALAEAQSPDLFLLVHYFGRAGDALAAQEFCQSMSADLIEDGAHALMASAGIGAIGRFAIFSPYKLLGLPDGAVVLTRGLTEGQQHSFSRAMDALPAGNPAQSKWILKRLIQIFVPQFLLPRPLSWGPARFFDDPEGPTDIGKANMDRVSERLLGKAVSRIDHIAAARIQNAERLWHALSGVEGWTPLVDGAGGAAPYRLVLRCASAQLAAARYTDLREKGIPVESWPDMPPEVMEKADYHSAAIELRRTLLCFPVHQGLDAAEMIRRLSR